MRKKRCSGCLSLLPLTAFHRCRTNPDGYQYQCRACCKVLRALRKDRCNARRRAYRRENAATVKLLRRRDYLRYAEANRARCRHWRKLNPEKQAAASRRWRRTNPERVLQHNNDRRARLAKCGGKFTVAEWKLKCSEYAYRCAYCRCRGPLTRHHVVPISRGGSNTINNIVPACKQCNCRIKTKVVQPGELIP